MPAPAANTSQRLVVSIVVPTFREAGNLRELIERVFAVSGAALLIRSAALTSLRVEGELFDEDFFAYREEIDLAWRANLLGWSCLYVPRAVAAHRRGWTPATWREIDRRIRRHSFKNRYLEMIKNERASEFFRDLPSILACEGMRFGYALLRDRSRFPAYSDAARLAGRAWAKRRLIQKRASGTGSTWRGPDSDHSGLRLSGTRIGISPRST